MPQRKDQVQLATRLCFYCTDTLFPHPHRSALPQCTQRRPGFVWTLTTVRENVLRKLKIGAAGTRENQGHNATSPGTDVTVRVEGGGATSPSQALVLLCVHTGPVTRIPSTLHFLAGAVLR